MLGLTALIGIIRQKAIAIMQHLPMYVLGWVFVCLQLHKHARILPL